jgi:putative lipoic acid-binding regulatory protein
MSYTESEERLLELLGSQHTFPCAFPIKIMFRTADATGADLLATVASVTGVRTAGAPKERPSSKGKYTSLTASFQVGQPEQIIEIYRHLATVTEVVSYF